VIDLAIDGTGNLYVADYNGNRIRKINTSGFISTIAGDGMSGNSGDGGPATLAKLSGVKAVTIDASGNLYILADSKIRRVNTAGIITTIAGGGGGGVTIEYGSGIPATNAALVSPERITTDGYGNLYISEHSRILKVNPSGIITRVAGTSWGGGGYSVDGLPATATTIYNPMGMTITSSGDLYFAEKENRLVRKISASGIISTIAGNRDLMETADQPRQVF
jgi:sugar lactone lactonase YvrE